MSTPATSDLIETPFQELLLEFKLEILKLQENSKKLKDVNIRLDNEFLTRFLKTAKKNIKKALNRYEMYYTTILSIPKVDSIISGDPEQYKWLTDQLDKAKELNIKHLQYYGIDNQKRHIIGISSKNVSPLISQDSFLETFIVKILLTMDIILENNQECQNDGFVFIEDVSAFNAKFLKLALRNRKVSRILPKLFSETMPIKIAKIWIANEPVIAHYLFSVIKQVLSSKMIKRVNLVHHNHNRIIDDLGGLEFTPDMFKNGEKSDIFYKEFYDFNIHDRLRKVFPMKDGI